MLLDWSFKKLFGRSIKSACPLATTSKVYVDVSSNKVCDEIQYLMSEFLKLGVQSN